jgi:hypothetical protein
MATATPPNGNEARFERPRRAFVPSAALLSGEPAIPSQRKAVEEFLAAEAAKRAAETKLAIDALRAATVTPTSSRESSPVVPKARVASSLHGTGKGKRAYVEDSSEDEVEELDTVRENARINPKPAGKSVFGNHITYF